MSVTNIVKRFGGVTALNGVDLELGEGEVLGLIGPNGSGKTTLVNCISGVLAIDEGAISLHDRSLARASRTRRARAGIARTFQTPRLFAGLTVRENIAAGLRAARQSAWIGGARTRRLAACAVRAAAAEPARRRQPAVRASAKG